MTNGYTDWKSSFVWSHTIPHYYGDQVRALFITMAVLSFVALPLWGYLLPFEPTVQIGAALLLVLLAGLTTAKNIYVMLTNATVAGVSVLLLETYAIQLHQIDSTQLFLAREAGVLIMLGALYFSVKTVRAMMSGKLGHADTPLEFESATESPSQRPDERPYV